MNHTGALEFMIEGCGQHALSFSPSFSAAISFSPGFNQVNGRSLSFSPGFSQVNGRSLSFSPGFSQVSERYYDRRTVLTVFFVAPLENIPLYEELILFRVALLAMMLFLLGDVSSNSVYL